MSYHDHVDTHRLQVARGIDQRLALRNARAGCGDIHSVRRQPLLGKFEGDPGARRVLEEEIDYCRPSKRRHLLDCSLAYLLERLGGVENETNLVASERLEPEKILAERPRHEADLGTITTSVRSSSSATITSTRSSGPTSTFFPTTSAWIGSSRPPRSMRTASDMEAGRPKSA